ncbi:MAG: hypothetical protein DI598_01825 [Pseudopedobacter saltans]|uniref:Uncharacterized protein n=1 Tax=Pseudopedobacter saltans TaxID=151895 RepID=A0A2W5F7N6_9SPHI|nr:MAG: hypothetical protein DI598_01825 [Pseudopedobacter saltans]
MGTTFAQKGKFSKPKEAIEDEQNLQGHLIDDKTYEFDKDNKVKVGDSVIMGDPVWSGDFRFVTEKKGLLGKIGGIKDIARTVIPGSTAATDAVEYSTPVNKVGSIRRGTEKMKDHPDVQYSELAKSIMGKTMVITEFKEKDYGKAKEVIATAELGKKKFLIVMTLALMQHEIYLKD